MSAMDIRTYDNSPDALIHAKALRLLELTHHAWGLHEQPVKKKKKARPTDWRAHFNRSGAHNQPPQPPQHAPSSP